MYSKHYSKIKPSKNAIDWIYINVSFSDQECTQWKEVYRTKKCNKGQKYKWNANKLKPWSHL